MGITEEIDLFVDSIEDKVLLLLLMMMNKTCVKFHLNHLFVELID